MSSRIVFIYNCVPYCESY